MSTTTATLGGQPVRIHAGGCAFPPGGLLGLDVESTWMSDRAQFDPGFRVRTVQVATKDQAWIYDLTDEGQRLVALEVLTSEKASFCSHTPMDVLSIKAEFGIDIADRNIDTRSLAIMANPDKLAGRDLKELATEYGMLELKAADDELYAWILEGWLIDGGKRNAAKAAIEEAGWNALATMDAQLWPEVFTRYAGLDAIACRRLVELLIPATKAPATLLRKEQWLDTRSNRITIRGCRVDTDRLDVQLEEARTICGTAKAEAFKLTEGVNIAGSKIVEWLGAHGVDWDAWPGERSKKTGAPSLAKDNLGLVGTFPLDDVGRAVFERMQSFRSHSDDLVKCEGIARRIVTTDGIARIHPELNPRGATTTARMSSAGPNMQNFSKKNPKQRGLFLPEPGRVLATIDFAQIELRVVAALAREDVMIDTIKAGEDLHNLTVKLLADLGVTITRQVAKMANFLIVYGGGPTALASQAGIPLDVAREVVYGIRRQYPSIDALKEYLGRERDGIRTISNRYLPVTTNRVTGELRGYATVNYAVQSAARELLVDAWWRFEEEFGRRGVVWWPIHDELVLQIPEDEVPETLADAEAAMSWREFMGVPIEAAAIVLRDEEGVSRWMPGDLVPVPR